MAYKALYRSYRPKSFSEVTGQEHITKTFKNALKKGSLTHAYLFSGPRGTGKTSVAKIIAKAVNCIHAPVEEPCNECDLCLGINEGSVSDVIEIDAASNNGVDEIREIRDKVKYLPTIGKYKVYIIDEVHMLSTGAFNALLKTLEEPPQHVIFILATTEPHKIPQTILSRCQRFDFRAISTNNIIKRMRTVINLEKINIDEDAITVIAESSEGGMRDALSLLDQTLSYADGKITEEDVRVITGSVSRRNITELIEYIENNDIYNVLEQLNKLIDLGKEPKKIINDLITKYRDLLVYKNSSKAFGDSFAINDDFIKLSNRVSVSKLFENISVLNKFLNDMKFSENVKTLLELALIKITVIKQKEEGFVTSKPKENPIKDTIQVKKEETVIEDVKEENQIIKSDEPKQEVIEKKPIKNINDYKNTYKVEFIEKVLKDAIKKDEKMPKEELQLVWATMMDSNLNGDYKVASMLNDAEIAAVGREGIILVYPDEGNCNSLMTPANMKVAKKLINRLTGYELDYICIPKIVWKEKRSEFVDQMKNKKEIKLTPIDYKGLLDVGNIEVASEEKRDPTIEKAINLFGEEVVKID